MENLKYFLYYDSDIPKGLEVRNFSTTHFAWLTITLIIMALCIFLYCKLSQEVRRKVMKGYAILIVMCEVARTAWAVSVGHYEINRMLPLHLCGVMIFIEFFAVFTNKKFLKEFTYCCGLPGAFIALLTPEPSGYPLLSFQYLQSITIHALLALVPLLWVIGDRYRPDIKYLFKCFMLLCSLTVFNAAVNVLLNSNYMFICKAPAQTPIELLDKLVGSPWYVGLLLICVVIVWTLMYVPWIVNSAVKKKKNTITGLM